MGAHGESRGEVARTVLVNKPIVNSEGKMLDSRDGVEWEQTKEEVREIRTLMIDIDAGSRSMGTQACEIQALSGGYSLWQTPSSSALDLNLETILRREDRVWTNSDLIRRRIMQEK